MLPTVAMWEFGLHMTKHLGFLMENGNSDFYERLLFFKCLQKHLQANQPGASHFVASVPAVNQSRDHFCSAFCSHCQALGLAQNYSTQSRMNE